jgi:hypothetical protein
METAVNMEKSRYRFYGCYQGDYEKLYRWQCKAFQTQFEANNYTNNVTRDTTSLSVVIPINNNIPNICDRLIVQNQIRKYFNHVDINQD